VNTTVKLHLKPEKLLGSSSEDYYYWAAWIIRAINLALAVVSFAAISSLVLQYGFYLSDEFVAVLTRVDLGIVQFFFWQYIIKVALARSKWSFIRKRWFESGLALLILLETALIFGFMGIDLVSRYFFDINITAVTEVYIGLAQILIILNIVTEGIKYNTRIVSLKFHPSQTLIISFLVLILVGTGLLMLPRATPGNVSMSFLDALFTATSATCVTGLTVVDTSTYFTRFGQIIILVLVQIGGLGLMTLSSFLAIFFGRGIGIRERVVLHQMMNVEKIGTITNLLRNAVLITLGIEAAGVVVLMFFWVDQGWTFGQLIYNSVFHSICAFNNAGFSTFSDSLVSFQNNTGVLLCISVLVILGGLGYIVLMDLSGVIKSWHKFQRNYRTNIQTRMVLIISAILLVVGFLLLLLLDENHWGYLRVLTAFFNSITARSAGYNTIDMASLSIPSSLVVIVLMFIGASPGSTGGGIKTTTLGVLWSSIIAIISGQNRIVIFKRRLPFLVLNRALVVFAFAVMFVTAIIFMLSLTETARGIDIVFEAVSAFATCGLSRGLTPHLSIAGKVIIVISMFIGRLGALTLAFAITASNEQSATRVEYPSEAVMIG
jgi:potassium uptake TrkH family protein